jgi:hypothetical protein
MSIRQESHTHARKYKLASVVSSMPRVLPKSNLKVKLADKEGGHRNFRE